MNSFRLSNRMAEELRQISFKPDVNIYAEGSCQVKFGETKVLCTATYDRKVPRFIQGTKKGWLTAEYSMLPRATKNRTDREAKFGHQFGRTVEIQRLIGRSLRAAIDLEKLGEHQIIIDCDVLQADGGTRTAAISGGYVALALAIDKLLAKGSIKENPLKHNVAAISCGVFHGQPILDLDYQEDSHIDVDANFIFTSNGELVEIQASSERETLSVDNLMLMTEMAYKACQEIFAKQDKIIEASR